MLFAQLVQKNLHLPARALVLALFAASACAEPATLKVALTFDDLPATHGDLAVMREVTAKITGTLRTRRIPAAGFVNEYKLIEPGEIDERTALLQKWLDAGAELGNHTYSHIAIDRVPLERYQEDVIRGETITRTLLERQGKTLRYFRHTQLRTGTTAEYQQGLARWLESRGYKVAPVTIDNNEYVFAHVYADAKRRGDEATMQRVAGAYIPYLRDVTAHFERLSRTLFGYEIPQVLLLHANELNADHFEAVLGLFESRGYQFIALDAALQDPAYRLPDVVSPRGLSWLHRWALGRGLRPDMEPSEPAFIRELYQQLAARR